MKQWALFVALTHALAIRLDASTNFPSPTLVGIVNPPGQKCALLEVGSGRFWNHVERWILAEGQREGEVEVLRINPEHGTVEVRIGMTNALLTLKGGPETKLTPPPSIAFEGADLGTVLELYAGFAGRTVLRHPTLPAQTFALRVSAATATAAAKELEAALNAKDLLAIPHEEKFVLIVPKAQAEAARPRLVGKQWLVAGKNEVMPPGFMNWKNAESAQLLSIYADLVGRKLDRDEARHVRSIQVVFKNQTPLTRSEMIHAMDVLLEWWDIKIVAVGDGYIRPEPFSSK